MTEKRRRSASTTIPYETQKNSTNQRKYAQRTASIDHSMSIFGRSRRLKACVLLQSTVTMVQRSAATLTQNECSAALCLTKCGDPVSEYFETAFHRALIV